MNLVNVIPAGVVVFFPSYDYEELVYRHLGRGSRQLSSSHSHFKSSIGSVRALEPPMYVLLSRDAEPVR